MMMNLLFQTRELAIFLFLTNLINYVVELKAFSR